MNAFGGKNITSHFQQNPGEPHWTTVKTILKYLRNTKDMFLVYGGNPEAELRVYCYCDAGFETDRDDTKSQIGYVFILNGGAVDWKSSKQSTTAMSATEAEYIAASEAGMEAVWIRKFILRLGIVPTINEPIKMFCDNSATLHFVYEPGVHKGVRHYHRRYHYVRECIKLGNIKLLKVHTDDNLADLFMKALSKGKLTQHARSMGLRLSKGHDLGDAVCNRYDQVMAVVGRPLEAYEIGEADFRNAYSNDQEELICYVDAEAVKLLWSGEWAVIIEQLVKVGEKSEFWSINEEVRESLLYLKNTMYHSRQILRIPRLRRIQDQCMTLKNTPFPYQ
ncbi:hypothetical protein Tco_1193249 [Tanacetum coccineum]